MFVLLMLSSCRDDKVINEPPYNPYGAILINDTKGQIYVENTQLVIGMPNLEPGDCTESVYSPTANVIVNYFGEGTYFKKIEKTYTLEKDKISNISLTYP